MLQNGSRRAPGGLPRAKTKAEMLFDPFWGALGALLGALGTSWAAPGASWAAPGGHFGFPGASFWSFLGLREAILEGMCARGACSAEKGTTINDFQHYWKLFWVVYCVDFFALLAAPARERILKKQRLARRVLHVSHVGRLRAERKRGRRTMNK